MICAQVADQREDDLALLRALLKAGALTEIDSTVFGSMLDDIEGDNPKYQELTLKRREWASDTADRLGVVWQDPAVRNANVPRGAEVPVADVLRNLPKKPPVRKYQ